MTKTRESVTLRAKRDNVDEGTKQKDTRKQLTIRLPEDLHRALKVRVAQEGRNMAELVERLVREYLVEGRRA